MSGKRLKPVEIMADYADAFASANTMNNLPHLYHAGGWYTIKSHGTQPRRYRRAQIIAMTERLRERLAAPPDSKGAA